MNIHCGLSCWLSQTRRAPARAILLGVSLALLPIASASAQTTITGVVVAESDNQFDSDTVTVEAGVGNQLQLADGVNLSNDLIIDGGGVVAQGVLYVPAGNAAYGGPININAAADAGGHFATAPASLLTINGAITSAIPVTIRSGTIVYTGAQDYTGGTSLLTENSRARIHFNQILSMPSTGSVNLAGGTSIGVNVGGAGEFSASGTGAGTIHGLLNGIGGQGAAVDLVAGSSIAINTANAAGTVEYTSPFTSTNNVGLLKLGEGTLSLTDGGTYNGAGAAAFPFVVRQGTVLLNGDHTVNGEAVIGGTYGTAAGAEGFDATVQIDSGNLTVNGWLSVGRGNGVGNVSSDLVINNSATVTAQNMSAGFNGSNAANMPKGSITLNDDATLTVTGGGFWIGESNGSDMTMTINDSATVNATAANVGIGRNAGQGTVIVNGGTLNAGTIDVGRGENNTQAANGTLTVNAGGTVNSEGDFRTGFAGSNAAQATVNIEDGGTINVATATKRWMIIGRWDATNSTINVNGGDLNLNTNTDIRFAQSNNAGTNVINLNGGAITSYSDNGVTATGAGVVDLMQGGAAGTNNTFNLNGGTLTARQVISGTNNGTRTFNFNGGTLQATGDTAAFVALGTGSARANVRDGGAIIDTNGFNTTITQALLHSDVEGDAEIDGGLTKLGAGTLTLTGVNTYTGNTFVSAGALATTGDGTLGFGNVTVADGAALTLGNAESMAETAFLFFGTDSLIGLDFEGAFTLAGITYTADSSSIGLGSYSAGDLNTFFGVDNVFSGTGNFEVIPEPSTYALIFGVLGLAFAAYCRRRKA